MTKNKLKTISLKSENTLKDVENIKDSPIDSPTSIKDFYEEALNMRMKFNGCADSRDSILSVIKELNK